MILIIFLTHFSSIILGKRVQKNKNSKLEIQIEKICHRLALINDLIVQPPWLIFPYINYANLEIRDKEPWSVSHGRAQAYWASQNLKKLAQNYSKHIKWVDEIFTEQMSTLKLLKATLRGQGSWPCFTNTTYLWKEWTITMIVLNPCTFWNLKPKSIRAD